MQKSVTTVCLQCSLLNWKIVLGINVATISWLHRSWLRHSIVKTVVIGKTTVFAIESFYRLLNVGCHQNFLMLNFYTTYEFLSNFLYNWHELYYSPTFFRLPLSIDPLISIVAVLIINSWTRTHSHAASGAISWPWHWCTSTCRTPVVVGPQGLWLGVFMCVCTFAPRVTAYQAVPMRSRIYFHQ